VVDAPLVSVVIPTHNSVDLAPEAVESVLAQTYEPLETVVIDDGSTDETVAQLERFSPRITLIRQEHQGPAVARNAGLRASHGEIVAFLDSDDIWMPEKLKKCVAALQAHPEAGVIYTALDIHQLETGLRYRQQQYTHSGWMAQALFTECRGVNTSTLVVRRKCIDEVGPFDEEFFRAQDWDLMLRLAEVFPYVHLPQPLTERRLHNKSLSVTHAHLYKKYNLLVLEKALARRPEVYQAIKDRAFCLAYLRFGLSHYGEFRMSEARGEFRRALAAQWNHQAFSYWLRTWLPVSLVRMLRRIRLGMRSHREHRDWQETYHE
jgi:glycosyltransferase involved in cell wall biosynthesis